MGTQTSSMYTFVLALFLFCGFFQAQGQGLAGGAISDADFNALLTDLKSNNFFTAATVMGLLARPFLRPSMTLLIPTDNSLVTATSIPPSQYVSLIKFHILQKNFEFKQLRLLPVGTLLPTALPNFKVEVTSNTAANFSLDGAQITSPNLCPSLFRALISCQGISAILNPNSRALPPSPLAIPPSAFASVPPTSSPIFLPPSAAPTPPPPSFAPSVSTPSASPSAPTLAPSALIPPPSVSPSPSPTPPPAQTLPGQGLVPSPSTSPGIPLPPVSPAPPPLVLSNPEGLAPGLLPPNAAASLQVLRATLVTSLGVYALMVAHSL